MEHSFEPVRLTAPETEEVSHIGEFENDEDEYHDNERVPATTGADEQGRAEHNDEYIQRIKTECEYYYKIAQRESVEHGTPARKEFVYAAFIRNPPYSGFRNVEEEKKAVNQLLKRPQNQQDKRPTDQEYRAATVELIHQFLMTKDETYRKAFFAGEGIQASIAMLKDYRQKQQLALEMGGGDNT